MNPLHSNDLLNGEGEDMNLQLNASSVGSMFLEPVDAERQSVLIVSFSTQTIAEQALFRAEKKMEGIYT